MDELQTTQLLSLRDTAKGIAVRAGILSVAGLVIGAWVFGLAAKTAAGIVKFTVGLLLLSIGAGFVAVEVRKVRQRFDERPT
jgi:ascorbate-specific PTS system EIIC-type component UlaA